MAQLSRTQKAGSGAALVAALALAVPLVQKWEGKVNDPYRDIVGVLTVCWGQTNVTMRHYSDAECGSMLTKALGPRGAKMQGCLPNSTPLPTLAAFISLGYNEGEENICRSTAATRLWSGNVAGACDAFLMWNKARNPVTRKLEYRPGLANRRADERAVCLRGVGP